jgi:hypothetical protein
LQARRQRWITILQRVLVTVGPAAAHDLARDPLDRVDQHPCHFAVAQRRRRQKARLRVAVGRVEPDAVSENYVPMWGEPQGALEALQHADGAAVRLDRRLQVANRLGLLAVVGLDRAQEGVQHGGAEFRVPRQDVPQRERHGQHKLAAGHARQHALDQMRRAFGHSFRVATGAYPALLARERHELILATAVTPDADKTTRQKAAVQVALHRLGDERRQPAAVALRLCQTLERRPVLPDEAVLRRELGPAADVGDGGTRRFHTRCSSRRGICRAVASPRAFGLGLAGPERGGQRESRQLP